MTISEDPLGTGSSWGRKTDGQGGVGKMQMGAKIENFGELFGVLLGEQLGARSEKFGELFGASGPP